MEIRELTQNDMNQILKLRIEIQNYDLRYVKEEQISISEKELKEKTEKYLKEHLNKDLILFGIFNDKELIANCGFYIDTHFPTYVNPLGLVGYICNVFTKEEYRNKGYQRKVFEKCFCYAKEMGITRFKLSSKNEKAIKMYTSFGFTKSVSGYELKIM